MTTYTWNIAQLDCASEQDGYQNVVRTVHWRLVGIDGTHSADVYGSVALSGPGQPFTSYNQLSQTQVIGWVESALGEEQILSYQNNIAQQIANQINPSIVAPPLPWQS